jgi:hypothetical protein
MMRKSVWPVWLPYPSSWCNALILSLVLTGFVVILGITGGLSENFAKMQQNPELYTVSLIFLLILPIPVIALVHHFILISFLPMITKAQVSRNIGFFPSVLSWKEGLYSWLVFILSTAIAILLCTIILPLFQVNYKELIYQESQRHRNIQATFAILWLISAAGFYQLEYFAKRRLNSDDLIAVTPEIVDLEPAKIGTNIRSKWDEPVFVDSKPTSNSTTVTESVSRLIKKNRNLPKRLFIVIFVPLVIAWLYFFVNLPAVKENLSTNLALEIPTQQSPSNTPSATNAKFESSENDIFEQAVDLGNSAEDLAKFASSKEEWKAVASQWKASITLLKRVSSDNPNYVLAEAKAYEFQKKLNLARKNAKAAN